MDRPDIDNDPAPAPDNTSALSPAEQPQGRPSSQYHRGTRSSAHRTSQVSFAEACSNYDLPANGEPNRPSLSLPQRETKQSIDWIVPVEKPHRVKTVGERLQPTLSTAETEKIKYASKAKMTGYALNVAIGMQVMLGALTTGVSAATTGKSTSIAICVLGGISTMVASYLARARGSNEPELSITRVKDLEQFIRECKAFQMDHGHCAGHEFDSDLESLRRRFEELLGNANGERKLSTPV